MKMGLSRGFNRFLSHIFHPFKNQWTFSYTKKLLTTKPEDNHAVVSTFDLFSIGIGPSSSHTVGPMRAAKIFVTDLKNRGILDKVTRLRIDLYGSLALTGVGHGTPNAILLGMEGEAPEKVDTYTIKSRISNINETEILTLDGIKTIKFNIKKHLVFHYYESLPQHPNGMRFIAFNEHGDPLITSEFFSIGGGFVIEANTIQHGDNLFYKAYDKSSVDLQRAKQNKAVAVLPFRNAEELLDVCKRERMTIAQVVYRNELQWRTSEQIKNKIMDIWITMNQSIQNGCINTEEYLPGNLKVRRRAPGLYQKLISGPPKVMDNSLVPSTTSYKKVIPRWSRKQLISPAFDYLSLYAIAVKEENASGGRVVTAPTNGAAGVIPAVLKYFLEFISENHARDIMEFLFTSAAIGMLYKRGASISAAEMGCQGEVGVACSMSAAGFAAVMGATPEQVENAAEIGMEHNLGLTCDPIDGLVQIPCIERNALGAVKAITAAQLALNGDGYHRVTLDQVIETMRQTGLDMQSKYKETSQGGLAVNVPLC
ncbi:L-serine ammonia-lyase [Gigaspora rosea]|uniref:L-serine ammonia-lyase n=1 Tax=Gigaspora rosea TaxID=44941 RepID=A0A397VVE4_9GLOM|nr:L-serine ammonia-lyase [Gigaspora rosea]